MKNLRNMITGDTRLESIIRDGLAYGTEEWHKRATGYTTATAFKVLAHAMQRQGKAVDMSAYTDTPDSQEAAEVLVACKLVVHKLGLVGFKFFDDSHTLVCNVFEQVE